MNKLRQIYKEFEKLNLLQKSLIITLLGASISGLFINFVLYSLK